MIVDSSINTWKHGQVSPKAGEPLICSIVKQHFFYSIDNVQEAEFMVS